MAWLGRSRSPRRLDVRLRNGNGAGALRTRLLRREHAGPLAVGAFALIAAVAIVLAGEERFPWRLDQRLDRPITARVDFDRLNQTKTAQAREAMRRTIPSHYRLNATLLEQVAGELREVLNVAKASDGYKGFVEAAAGRWELSEESYDWLRGLAGGQQAPRFAEWTDALVERLSNEYLVQLPTAAERDPLTDNAVEAILDRGEGRPDRVSKQRLGYVTSERHVVRIAKDLAESFPPALRPAVAALLVRTIRVDPAHDRYQPVYVFDRTRTQAALDAAQKLPPVSEHYKRGEVLAPPGILTADVLSLLEHEHREYLSARRSSPEMFQTWLLSRLGFSGAVILAVVGLALYARTYYGRAIASAADCARLAALPLAALLVARTLAIGHGSETWAVAPSVAAAAVLSIAYAQRFALGVAGVLAVLVTLAVNAGFGLFLLLGTVNAVAVCLLGEIRSRLRLVQVGTTIALVAGAMAFLVGLIERQPLTFALDQAGTAAAAALLACATVFVLLPVAERLFHVATALTLLEWADTSTALLKQFIQRAPGTWQHSHLLGSMAEAAADEIHANGLLARVGAYYHDIGKMCKPSYFAENQQAHMNVHDRLAPRMSLLVILGHVKDGLALAEEHGLPRVLHQFIAEHHGTTIVRFFHSRAERDQVARGGTADDPEVDETEFRYPGPRPRCKESAILMLCDSVEGAVRTLAEPTPGRIESLVHEIAMERLMDGQLDDCDITLKELSRIEQSLVKSLCSIYHGRIAYPKPASPVSAPASRSA